MIPKIYILQYSKKTYLKRDLLYIFVINFKNY